MGSPNDAVAELCHSVQAKAIQKKEYPTAESSNEHKSIPEVGITTTQRTIQNIALHVLRSKTFIPAMALKHSQDWKDYAKKYDDPFPTSQKETFFGGTYCNCGCSIRSVKFKDTLGVSCCCIVVVIVPFRVNFHIVKLGLLHHGRVGEVCLHFLELRIATVVFRSRFFSRAMIRVHPSSQKTNSDDRADSNCLPEIIIR